MLRPISMFFVLAGININSGAGDPLTIYTLQFKLEAEKLPDSKVPGVGAPDPICKVKLQQFGLGGYKSWKQTELLSKTNNPKWTKVFEITWSNDGTNKQLKFEVHDKHRGEIAEYDVDVHELIRINEFYVQGTFADTAFDIRNDEGTKVGKFHIKHRIVLITADRSLAACPNHISLQNNLLIVLTLIYFLRLH